MHESRKFFAAFALFILEGQFHDHLAVVLGEFLMAGGLMAVAREHDIEHARADGHRGRLAGVEIAAMVRMVCGIDCPICVDNTESIAAFNNVPMPTQTILLRFVKGQTLTVQSRNNLQVVNGAELKKAS